MQHIDSPGLQLLSSQLRETLPDDALPGVEVIGLGYDPFGKYASLDSATANLFDWSSCPMASGTFAGKHFSYPTVMDVLPPSRSSEITTISQQSVYGFQRQFSASAKISGSYNFFSGSLQSEFALQDLTDSQRSLSRVQEVINEWSIRLGSPESLRQYVRPAVAARLRSITTRAEAVQLFVEVGSHFLTGVLMGGRATASSATTKTSEDKKFDLQVQADASYKALTGQLSAEAKAKYAEAVDSFTAQSETSLWQSGGDPSLGSAIWDGQKDVFEQWRKSVADDPTFVDFSGAQPLTGIWELCDDDAARQVIQDAFLSWAEEKSAQAQLRPDYLTGLAVVVGDDSNVPAPPGYIRVGYDLNASVGGKFIYVCFHKERYAYAPDRVPAQGISELKVIYGQNTPTPEGMVKINVDLNQGAGGEYVFLCYRTVPWSPDACLTDITVVGGANVDPPPPYGFTRVDGDLNKGAGGDYIYLATAKTS